jgi:ABC-type phosphate transport system substrate-binding protein
MTSKRSTRSLSGVLVAVMLSCPGLASGDKKPVKKVIAVIVNKKNPAISLSRSEMRDIFLKRRQTWPSGDTIVPINGKTRSAIREAFEKLVLGMSPREVGAYWVKQAVTGRATPPRQIGSCDLARRMVAVLPGAIAYIELSRVDDTVKVVKINDKPPTGPDYKYFYHAK